jgi:SAM-dependent methyltransferase
MSKFDTQSKSEINSTPWEYKDMFSLYEVMTGESPERKRISDFVQTISERRESDRSYSDAVLSFSENPENTVALEIGSGMGFTASAVALKIKHLYCLDISRSFLDIAEKECSHLNNVSFHLNKNANFDFIEDESLDFVYSIAVFVHLNLKEIYLYLKSLHSKLKSSGRVFFTFMRTEKLDYVNDEDFLRSFDSFSEFPYFDSQSLCYNSETAIKDMLTQLGYDCGMLHEQKSQRVNVFLKKR